MILKNQITDEKVFEELGIQPNCAETTIAETKQIIKSGLKHIGTILSLLAITFIVLIYVYQMGYLKAFNIPYKYISINLQNHIPLLYVLLSYSACVSLHIIDYLTRKSFKSSGNLNLMRILIFFLLAFNGIYRLLDLSFLSKSWIAIGITVILEFFAILKEKGYIKLRKNKPKHVDIYDSVHKKIGYFIMFDCGVLLIAALMPFLYNLGDNMAKTQTEYEILYCDKEPYVVVSDYKENGIIQKAEINGSELLINTSNYKVISKNDTNIEYKEFEKVTIKGAE